MSKKFGKFLLFSAVAGAAAYGAYQYLQSKDNTAAPVNTDDSDDDLDELFNEDLDEEPAPEKDRSYVSLNLDKAAAIASESFHKAKEVIADSVQQVRATVKSVAEGQASSETNFTDLTALQRESGAPGAETPEGEAPEAGTASGGPVTEEFFSQETPEAESSDYTKELSEEEPQASETPASPAESASSLEETPSGSNDSESDDSGSDGSGNSGSSGKVEDFFDDDDTL